MVAISSLAVVPIFVNAGAALLPALIAGLASLVALLLSPRAMMRLCRRKPWLPVVVVAIGFGVYFFPRMLSASGAVGGGAGAGGAAAAKVIDWAGIGRDMVRQERTPQAILTLRWQNDLDGAMALSTPLLDVHEKGSGTLYVTTTLFDVGNKYGTLEAINAADGTVLWSATKDGAGQYLKPFFSSPAVASEPGGARYLVVGQGLHEDKDCPLLCWRLEDGKSGAAPPMAWAVPTPVHVESSPAVFSRGGELYAVVGAGAIEGKDLAPIGNPGYVFCVALSSGKQVWQFPLNDAESSPAVDENGVVYMGSGFNGNAVVALRSEPEDALAGQPRQVWRTRTAFPAFGQVTLAGDARLGAVVLVGGGNGDYVYSDPKPAGMVLALDRADGRIRWQTPMPDSVLGRLTVTGGHVLAPCRDGQAYGLDLSTGAVRWHTRISATPGIPVLAGLATDGVRAFALAADGTLAVLSVSSGEVLERVKLSDEAKAPQNLSVSTPVYHDGTLYVATETMGLRAYKVAP